jgi:hypothetical protein
MKMMHQLSLSLARVDAAVPAPASARAAFAVAVAVAASLACGAAQAQQSQDVQAEDVEEDGGRVTRLNFGVDADGEGARGLFASIGIPITADDTLTAAAGRTEFDDIEVDVNGEPFVFEQEPADRFALYYRHGFERFGLRFGAERWGNDDATEIDDLSVGIDYLADRTDWSLDLFARSANVSVTFPPGSADRRERDVDAWGLSAGVGYYGDAYDLYGSLTFFEYGDDLDTGPIAARLGNASALAVADSLVETGVVVGGRRLFRAWTVGLEGAWYRSGIESIDTQVLSANAGFPLTSRVDLTFTLGAVDADDVDTTAYGVLALRCTLGD